MRSKALRDIATRSVTATVEPAATSDYFGINTFNARAMRDKLPTDVFAKLQNAVRLGQKLDTEIAPVVAQAMKEWAMSRGATHFCHWFQPMTGLTAEKHDAFLSFDENMTAIEAFTGEQLIQSEPDASSFPSGGLRATWEARGYTAWNPASPVFLVESAGTITLCVPSVFIGYHGEALDEMAPMIRASESLSQRAMELLTLIGDQGVKRVVTTLGPEQEFFIIDRHHYAMRPDLVMSGRTLLGAPPPRGQQLEDHYFVGIPERVMACFAEVERELYKLGVPIVTRHNEVAPGQYEMAPRFEETDLGVDHNHLVMTILKRVALRHGLQALMHEKPFAGINGSGKHCNWSMSITSDNELDGVNLLKPGKTPHQNLRFLLFLAAVLKGVHRHAGLLRAGIASSGNEHRLGANEAPPAIISVFMGGMLTRVIDDIAAGKTGKQGAEEAMIKLGVDKLPEIAKDNTDRNRTSPFAFTGAKFEFRAVGGSASIAFPVMLLTAAVAESVSDITAALCAELKKTKNVDNAVLKVVSAAFRETSKVRFEGNNYSEEWVKEAKKRGLLNLRRTPEALLQMTTKTSRDLFANLGVLSKEELEARYVVRVERYIKDMLIELHTINEVARTQVLPASFGYLQDLTQTAANAKAAGITTAPQVAAANEIAKLVGDLQKALGTLEKTIAKAEGMHHDPADAAEYLTSTGADAMAAVREACDALELRVDDARWPLPRYREMLFPV